MRVEARYANRGILCKTPERSNKTPERSRCHPASTAAPYGLTCRPLAPMKTPCEGLDTRAARAVSTALAPVRLNFSRLPTSALEQPDRRQRELASHHIDIPRVLEKFGEVDTRQVGVPCR